MEAGTILISISIALIAGLVSNRLIKLVNLPNVTAYLIIGILLGPYFFSLFFKEFDGFLSEELIESFGIIVDLALGFIAFSIGSEFKLSSIKKLGKGIITITLLQALTALILVIIALSIMCLATGSFVEKLPIIGALNKILGMALNGIVGLLLICLISYGLTFIIPLDLGISNTLIDIMQLDNPEVTSVSKFFYENNFLLIIIAFFQELSV
jgi:hypothetical protein